MPPSLPALRRSSANPRLSAEIANLRVSGRVFVDFLAGINRNLRDTASAWAAMAAILDDLKISDEARSALNDALGAQAASVKLIAASVANAVAAVHASKGNSSEFTALLHGLQGDITPAFATDVRFAAMKKAAAASETVDAVRKNVWALPTQTLRSRGSTPRGASASGARGSTRNRGGSSRDGTTRLRSRCSRRRSDPIRRR